MATRLFLKTLALLGGFAVGTANAVSIGGFTFADNAFADLAVPGAGVFGTSGGSVSSVLADTDVGTYAYSDQTAEAPDVPGQSVTLSFNDNDLFNGSGDDLVLFELGNASQGFNDSIDVTINSIKNTYTFSYTGDTVGIWDIAAAAINLDDFGVNGTTNISSILIGMAVVHPTAGTVPSLSLVGALNTTPVPVPAAVWLFGSGLIGMVGLARRKVR